MTLTSLASGLALDGRSRPRCVAPKSSTVSTSSSPASLRSSAYSGRSVARIGLRKCELRHEQRPVGVARLLLPQQGQHVRTRVSSVFLSIGSRLSA